MDLHKELLIRILSQENVNVTFPGIDLDINKLMSDVCYQAIVKIRNIIRDPESDDEFCFQKIEEIVLCLEDIGSNCGTRHDFG